jgi:hypothetical protein
LYRVGDGPAGASSGRFTDSNPLPVGHTKSPNFSTTNNHLYSHGNHLDPHHDGNGHPISNTNQQPVANSYTNGYSDNDGDIHSCACYLYADFYCTAIRNLDANSTFGDTDADCKPAAIGHTWGWGWGLIAIPVLSIADHYIFFNRQEIRI